MVSSLLREAFYLAYDLAFTNIEGGIKIGAGEISEAKLRY